MKGKYFKGKYNNLLELAIINNTKSIKGNTGRYLSILKEIPRLILAN